jgi:hypothetical protein
MTDATARGALAQATRGQAGTGVDGPARGGRPAMTDATVRGALAQADAACGLDRTATEADKADSPGGTGGTGRGALYA